MVPMRIPIHGNSMFPLVRMDRDMVTIMPVQERPRVGDIVMFHDPAGERFVLHRLWKSEEDRALTWGDNCDRPDGWMPWDMVWGKAVLIERGGRNITPDPKKGLPWARVCHVAGKTYRHARLQGGRAKRALKRLLGRAAKNFRKR